MDIIPKTGFKGLVQNWQSDLLAAVSVSLVAMPLALGIAVASEVPPMAGIMSAIIGGIVTTFFRGSHMAINGPAAGLIAVILGSIALLNDGSGNTLNYVMAAIVVSGGIQVLLGLLKLGRFADIFHSSVIHGILAAIGAIIIAKQIHVMLGTTTENTEIIPVIMDAFRNIRSINPFVAVISFCGLLLLIFHSRINYKFFHFLPAPMWVLLISIPFVYAFNYFEPHGIQIFNKEYWVGPDLLINIPDSLFDSIAHPNFDKINTLAFWSSVLSITLIASIESLASSKAVDKLDPYKRKTDLNKDLVGIGLSTMVSGALGGLPIITVIVRSTVNVHNHAKTKWSNLYHGLLLLIFIFLLAPVIQKVPLSALAVILVFTGFKLCSPKVFKKIYGQGVEQLIILTGTFILTLKTDLLIGIFGGLLLALLSHFFLAKLPITEFFRNIFNSGSTVIFKKDGSYSLNLKGVANFLTTIKLDKLLNQIPKGSRVNIDLSAARLVDLSIMEHLYDFKRTQLNSEGVVTITGLEEHISSSDHPLALKILTFTRHKVTLREKRLQEMSAEHGWKFVPESKDNLNYLETFYFFRTRPIKRKNNCISGSVDQVNWELIDVSFDEGAYLASEIYHTTLGLLRFPHDIPKFTIERKGLIDRYLDLSSHKDIDYLVYSDFSNDFSIKVEDPEKMNKFLANGLRELFENCGFEHLESNGESIMVFNDNLRLAQIRDYVRIIDFAKRLSHLTRS